MRVIYHVYIDAGPILIDGIMHKLKAVMEEKKLKNNLFI